MVSGDEGTKFSCKGINKRSVTDPINTYQKVLEDEQSSSAINSGFRARHHTMYSYDQEKAGFTYFYIKRVVSADKIHTKPLDIILRPPKLEL
jgi:hypothetical protein